MNFFNILQYYNLRENFVSSLIKFLLIPDEEHGLGYYTFEKILELVTEVKSENVINKNDELLIPDNEKYLGPDFGRIEIHIEFSYRKDSQRKKGILLIENKIFAESIHNKDQFGNKQLLRYLNYLDTVKADNKRIVYLVPESTDLSSLSDYYLAELNELPEPLREATRFIFWKHPTPRPSSQLYTRYFVQEHSFLDVFTDLLRDESVGTIGPLDPHLLYVIKSFVNIAKSGFAFDKNSDALVQTYADFKKNLKASDQALFEQLIRLENYLRGITGKPIKDTKATKSLKIGIPVPKEHWGTDYRNKQFFVLLKQTRTIDGVNQLCIRFDETSQGEPHWNIAKLENYWKGLKIKTNMDRQEGYIDVYLPPNREVTKLIGFEQLKKFRMDNISA